MKEPLTFQERMILGVMVRSTIEGMERYLSSHHHQGAICDIFIRDIRQLWNIYGKIGIRGYQGNLIH